MDLESAIHCFRKVQCWTHHLLGAGRQRLAGPLVLPSIHVVQDGERTREPHPVSNRRIWDETGPQPLQVVISEARLCTAVDNLRII